MTAPERPPLASTLTASLGHRLAWVGLVVVLLWLAVAWALS